MVDYLVGSFRMYIPMSGRVLIYKDLCVIEEIIKDEVEADIM